MKPSQPRLNLRRQKLARQYSGITRRLSLIQSAVVGVVLLVLVFTPLSAKLGHLLGFPQPWASALYFIILAVGYTIIFMPLSYYQGFVLPHRFGLSHQKFWSWLADRAKGSVLSFILALVVIIFVYWLMDQFPGTWWLWASIALFLLSLLLTRLTSTLLISMFFKLQPLRDSKLRRRLINLAKRAGAPILGVFTINLSSKSNTANAMLAGLGRTRRIILTDTMLKRYTSEEIEVVMAHELGHHIHRDISKMIAMQAVMILLGFYISNLILHAAVEPLGFQGIADAATLPLLGLTIAVLSIIITPFLNTYSRYVEVAADKEAIELTAKPDAFISAMTRLTNQNLSVADPSRWAELLFYDHPPYTKRISLANSYSKSSSGR